MKIQIIYEDGTVREHDGILNWAVVSEEDIRQILENNYEDLTLTDEQFKELCRLVAKYVDFRDDFPNFSDLEWTVRDILRDDMELIKSSD